MASVLKLAACAALAAMTVLSAGMCRAAPVLLYVEPVEVFNSAEVKEMAPGLRAVLASRVAGQGFEVTTDEGARETAAYTLRTTVTRLGGVYSIDSELLTRGRSTSGARSFETVQSVDGLMKGIEKVTEPLKARLAAASGTTPSAETQKAEPAPEKHPPGFMPGRAPERTPAPTVAKRSIADVFANYWEAAKIEGEATSVASADIDRDGRIELILTVRRDIIVCRETDKGLDMVWQGSAGIGFLPFSVTAGDIDRDGYVEVFLSGASGSEAFTQAYMWDGKALVKKGELFDAFARVVVHPDKGPELIGSKSVGGAEALSGILRHFTFNGKVYGDGPKIPLPDPVKTVNVQWVRFDGQPVYMMMLDDFHRIRIYDDTGKRQHVSESEVMGTRTRIEGERDPRTGLLNGLWEIDPPAVMWKAFDGHVYAVYHDNVEADFTPSAWGSYKSGSIAAVRWDGMALFAGGESPKFTGFFSGIARGAVDREGRGRLYATLVKSDGVIFRNFTTHIMAFDF